MANKKITRKVVLALCVSMIFMAQSVDAYAWRSRRHARHRYHHRYVRALPAAYIACLVGGLTYYYSSGVFYRRGHSGYVLVNAPVGTVVPALPREHQTIIIDGSPYYTYDNVYYAERPSGYAVVPAPAVTKVVQVEPANDKDDTYVINVPNANGSFTPVVIQKGEDGYIGPQGEYYPEQPTVDQLKAMYAK